MPGVRVGLLVLAMLSSLAFAHAHLTRTEPADGSLLSRAPARVQLTFAQPVRVTAAWLQTAAGPRQKLGVLPSATAAAQISLALPPLTAGVYVVGWRAVSADGHIMPGKLTFQLKPATSALQADSPPGRH